MNFIHSLQSEWLKTKRSAASWLCIIGGFFIPFIYLIAYLKNQSSINKYPAHIWETHFNELWQNMAIFLLPMGVILASSLITQMEFKNNTWKQLHASPQSYPTIFLSKYSVIFLMTVKFFLFFNIGLILSGLIPCLIVDGALPKEMIPIMAFLKGNVKLFIACMPILAIQYLISLMFKNFLVPVGIGLVGLIGSMIGNSWEYIFLSPYSYCAMQVLPIKRDFNLHVYGLVCFAIISVISYILYIRKKEKG